MTLFLSGYGLQVTQASIKDTDADGVSDEAEVNIYHTNPLVFDTDGDGRGDGDEILDKTDPLDSKSSWMAVVSAGETGLLGNPEQFVWYLGQISGVLVFILLTVAIVSGLILSALAFTNVVLGPSIYEAQRFVSWIALGTIALYFFSYYFADLLKTKAVGMVIPPTLFKGIQTAPDSGIVTAVAISIAAFYFFLAIIFTSKIRSKISYRTWRIIRYVSFGAYILFVLHGFVVETSSEWWMKVFYGVSLGLIIILIFVRIIFRNIFPAWRTRQGKEFTDTNTPLG